MALSQFGPIPTSARVVRERGSLESRGFAYVDYASLEDAVTVFEAAHAPGLVFSVDGTTGIYLPSHCFVSFFFGPR